MYHAPPPPVRIGPHKAIERHDYFSSVTSAVLNNRKALIAGVCVVAFVAIFCFILSRIKKRAFDWPVYSLRKLETPFAAATPESSPFVFGRGAHTPPLVMARPYNPESPGDYFGVVKITPIRSATLNVSTNGDYHEVVIYSYPDWAPVFSEININEVPFDFLKPGTYAVVVFSITPVKGELAICRNASRPRPSVRAHRTYGAKAIELREDAVSEAIAISAPSGCIEVMRATSSPTFVWPRSVFTRVETVFAVVPEDATAIFFAIPSFGYIVEGGSEHLGAIIHERVGMAIYRAIAQPPSLAGGLIGGIDSTSRVISITAVFPNVEVEEGSGNGVPKMSLHIYAGDRPSHTAIKC